MDMTFHLIYSVSWLTLHVHKDSAKSHMDEDSNESQWEGELKYKHIQYES